MLPQIAHRVGDWLLMGGLGLEEWSRSWLVNGWIIVDEHAPGSVAVVAVRRVAAPVPAILPATDRHLSANAGANFPLPRLAKLDWLWFSLCAHGWSREWARNASSVRAAAVSRWTL